jgi:hypothetical protein
MRQESHFVHKKIIKMLIAKRRSLEKPVEVTVKEQFNPLERMNGLRGHEVEMNDASAMTVGIDCDINLRI